MSVLIKGMGMPHNCFFCPLSVMNGERLYCEVTKDEVLRAKIAQDCPLIELPPHGDLIDRNDLRYSDFDLASIALDKGNPYKNLATDILARIETAPTILEAEGE